MTDPITVLRQYVTGDLDVISDLDETEHAIAALTQVENLVQAARNALPCVDRNATFPAQTLADALAPFKDTP